MTRRPGPVHRTEQLAVLLWARIASAECAGPRAEREALMHAAAAMHGARLVLSGSAAAAADQLYELAWARCRAVDAAQEAAA